MDYAETYSAVVRHSSLRYLSAMGAKYHYRVPPRRSRKGNMFCEARRTSTGVLLEQKYRSSSQAIRRVEEAGAHPIRIGPMSVLLWIEGRKSLVHGSIRQRRDGFQKRSSPEEQLEDQALQYIPDEEFGICGELFGSGNRTSIPCCGSSTRKMRRLCKLQ